MPQPTSTRNQVKCFHESKLNESKIIIYKIISAYFKSTPQVFHGPHNYMILFLSLICNDALWEKANKVLTLKVSALTPGLPSYYNVLISYHVKTAALNICSVCFQVSNI